MASKLQDLINRLCPNGVEYRRLGEIATDVFRGGGILRNQVTETGVPCVRYGEIYTTYGIWFDECVSHTKLEYIQSPKYFEHGDILFAITGESVEEIAKSTAYTGHERCLAGGDIVVLKHKQNPKYLAYALSTSGAQEQKSKGKVKSKVVHSSVPAIKDILIPVPPLEVQSEIVQILDNFAELTAELTAELEKRKKQYEHYRSYLLNDSAGSCKRVRLGDIASVERGSGLQKSDFVKTGIPCIHYGQIYTHFGTSANKTLSYVSADLARSLKHVSPGDIVMAVTSENLEDICRCTCWLGDEEIVTGGHTAIIRTSQIGKYLSYYFSTPDFFSQKKKLAHGTKVMEVTPKKLEDITIPLPPLAEQRRIVSILDRFDRLCNDLTSGLPAEIAARKKQYAYYRDKLLAFPRASCNGLVGCTARSSPRND